MSSAESKRRHPASLGQARRFLQSIGKCGSLNADAYLCTMKANHQGTNHKAEIMGGIDDGKLLAEWPW
jgi:hypothetical protein